MKNTVQRFSTLLIWLVSVVFAVLVLIQMAVMGGVIWLNSDAGQTYVDAQIAQANQSIGYDVGFEGIAYAFPQGLSVEGVSVSDAGGVIAAVDRIVLRPNLIGLGVRHFGLSLNVDTLALHRLPAAKEDDGMRDKGAFALKPFSLPDVYFRSFALDNLKIETLDVKEAVFGLPLNLSPTLSSRITLGDVIGLDAKLRVRGDRVPKWMPGRIALNGRLDPQSLEASLERLVVRNKHMKIEAQGNAGLGAQGRVDVSAKASVNDFTPFAEGVEGRAEMEAAITGVLDALSVSAQGVVSMPLLRAWGVSDVAFDISDDNLSAGSLGRAAIKATYQDKPIEMAARFDREDGLVLIQSITGQAPDLALSGEVNLDTDAMLAAGNVEIKAAKLSTYSTMAGVDIKGQTSANITLASEDETQGVSIKAKISDAVYEGVTLKGADMSAQVLDVKNPWPNALTLNVKDFRPAADVVIKTLSSTITQKQGDTYALSINASGRAAQNFKLGGGANLTGLKQSQISAEAIDLKLSSEGSAVNLRGRADMSSLDVSVKTSNFNLGALPVSLPEQLRNLALNAEANIVGPLGNPVIQAEADLAPITVVKGARVKIAAKGTYAKNLARVDIAGSGSAIDTLDGYAQLPLTLSLYPFVFDLPKSTPLEGRLNVNAQAKALAALALPVGHKLGGDVRVVGNIAGTVGDPDITGDAALSNGAYVFNAYGVELFDIDMKAGLSPEGVHITTLNAGDGRGGSLSGEGQFSFIHPQNTRLGLKLSDFKLLDSDKAKGTISADLDLVGRAKDYLLSGSVDLGQFDIIIPERFQSKIPELNIVKKGAGKSGKDQLRAVKLDVKVTADERVFVRGWGLDAEFGGKFTVDGALDDPQLNGALSSKRGRYEEFGRRFVLERAYLRFLGSVPPSPYLDILATADADAIIASVSLSGEVGSPSIALSSVPALPEDEVMSHILFGENLTKITPFQAIQLKQTLDRFTGKGGGGFDPLGMLRDITGLDDIRVDSDDEGETSVGVGKYLTEDVYLELEKGAGEASGTAKIQVEVTPNISVESEVGQDAQAGAGVLWKWDY